jgi:arginine utilization protein RocB
MRDAILKTLIELTAVQSVNGVPQAEDAYVNFLFEELVGWDYFARYPEDLFLTPLEGDDLERHNLTAIVRGADRTKKQAILLINHHDVVEVDDTDAFYPEKFMKKLSESTLTDDVRADLESGEWLFGRGVSDMKGGAAVQLSIIKEFSENPEVLNINLIFLSLADEENNGFGVHQAVRSLAEMKRDGWEFLLCIDSEPTITNQGYPECEQKALFKARLGGVIYTGSIGNATVLCLFAGKGSHVGEFYEGINAAVLAAKMVYETEGDPATADTYNGKRFSPAACLLFKTIAEGYSVTLPDRAAVVFNVLMAEKSITEILDYFMKKAEECGNEALERHYKAHGKTMRVVALSELKAMAGDKELIQLSKGDDIALVNRMITAAGLSGPLAAVGFIAPYCQARLNKGKTALDIRAGQSAAEVISYAETIGAKLTLEEVYEGISDLSEMGLDTEDIGVLTDNLAGYGALFTHPFEEMKRLNIPVINLGPIGKDAHKLTERVYIPYLTQTLPLLLKKLIECYNL